MPVMLNHISTVPVSLPPPAVPPHQGMIPAHAQYPPIEHAGLKPPQPYPNTMAPAPVVEPRPPAATAGFKPGVPPVPVTAAAGQPLAPPQMMPNFSMPGQQLPMMHYAQNQFMPQGMPGMPGLPPMGAYPPYHQGEVAVVDGSDKDMLKVQSLDRPMNSAPRRAVKPWLKYGERTWSGTKTTYLKCRYKSCGARKKINRRQVVDENGAPKEETTEELVGDHSNHDAVEIPDPAESDPVAIAQKQAAKQARKEGDPSKSTSRRAKKPWLKYGERSLANVTTTYYKCRFKGCPARRKVQTKVGPKDEHGNDVRTMEEEFIGNHDGHPPEGAEEMGMLGDKEEDGKDVQGVVAAALAGKGPSPMLHPMGVAMLPPLLGVDGHPDPNNVAQNVAMFDASSQQALEAAQARLPTSRRTRCRRCSLQSVRRYQNFPGFQLFRNAEISIAA